MDCIEVSLGSICNRIGDGIHGTPVYDAKGDYYFFNGSNIVDGYLQSDNNTNCVNESEYFKHRRDLSSNTLLLSINGTIGNVARYNGEKCILGKSVAYLNLRQNINRDFIYYVLKSSLFQEYIKNANGSTIKNVSLEMLRNYLFDLPSIEDQNKIGFILTTFDNKINILRSINDNLSEQGQAIFNELIINGESARVIKLTDIAHFQNGLPMQKNRPISGNGLPVLKIKELGQGHCDDSSERCREDIDNSVIINNGDVVFSWSGSLMAKIWCGGKCGLNQHLFKVTSENYPLWFYYYWLQYHMPNFIDIAANKATTMGHICRNHLEDATISLPNPEVMKRADSILSPLINCQIKLMEETTQLINLRNYLLPKLMSGEIDVSTLEIPN